MSTIVKITRPDGVLRNLKKVAVDSIITDASPDEIRRWLHFGEAQVGTVEKGKFVPAPPPVPEGPAKLNPNDPVHRQYSKLFGIPLDGEPLTDEEFSDALAEQAAIQKELKELRKKA